MQSTFKFLYLNAITQAAKDYVTQAGFQCLQANMLKPRSYFKIYNHPSLKTYSNHAAAALSPNGCRRDLQTWPGPCRRRASCRRGRRGDTARADPVRPG